MTSLPDHDALLDRIVKARDQLCKKSSRLAATPPRIDLKQQRYPVLPTISSNSNHCSDEGIKKDSEKEATAQTTPLPAIQQQPSYVYPVPMATNANLVPGSVQILPIVLPWQHAQVPQASLFNAHYNTTYDINNGRATKKEPWFKKFNYRPMSEERAALIIQRHCRGYLTRRNLEFQQYLSNRWLSRRLVDKIIDEALQNDLIPDVLIELLQERMNCGGWFAGDPEHRAQLLVCSRLVDEVVSELLPVCVRESNHELVIGYLHEHGVHREPLVHIVKSLVEEAVDELVREEVEGYISNTLRSYFTEAQATLLTSTLIEDTIDKQYLSLLAVEVMTEHSCDILYSEAIGQEVLVVVKECVMEEWARGDWSAGSVFVSPVIDEMMLSALLTHVANRGSVLDMEYYCDSVISEMMLRVCVHQMMNIHERQVTTQDNVMLQQLHQRMFQEMAFDVLLEAWTDLWK